MFNSVHIILADLYYILESLQTSSAFFLDCRQPESELRHSIKMKHHNYAQEFSVYKKNKWLADFHTMRQTSVQMIFASHSQA